MIRGSVLNPIYPFNQNSITNPDGSGTSNGGTTNVINADKFNWSYQVITEDQTIAAGYNHIHLNVVEGEVLINNVLFNSRSPMIELPFVPGSYDMAIIIEFQAQGKVDLLEVRKI